MAISEARSPGRQENGDEGFENGDLPAALSAIYSRYDRGNARTVRMRRESSSKRDGFPRGFSSGLLRKGETGNQDSIGETVNQDYSMEMPDFDTEQMGKDDESPEYGSAGERTPEIGSFHLAQETGGEESEAEGLNNNNNNNVDPPKEETKRHLFSRRKKSTENVDHAKPPIKAKREGYITSRLFAKPLAARVRLLHLS